jgi:hypothetical protein
MLHVQLAQQQHGKHQIIHGQNQLRFLPELNGPIAKVQTGDMLIIDAEAGVLDVEIDDDVWQSRPVVVIYFDIKYASFGIND